MLYYTKEKNRSARFFFSSFIRWNILDLDRKKKRKRKTSCSPFIHDWCIQWNRNGRNDLSFSFRPSEKYLSVLFFPLDIYSRSSIVSIWKTSIQIRRDRTFNDMKKKCATMTLLGRRRTISRCDQKKSIRLIRRRRNEREKKDEFLFSSREVVRWGKEEEEEKKNSFHLCNYQITFHSFTENFVWITFTELKSTNLNVNYQQGSICWTFSFLVIKCQWINCLSIDVI